MTLETVITTGTTANSWKSRTDPTCTVLVTENCRCLGGWPVKAARATSGTFCANEKLCPDDNECVCFLGKAGTNHKVH